MRIMLKKLLALSLAAGLAVPAAAQTIRSYITCPDRSELFAQQKHAAEFSTQRQENRNYIIIDPRQSYQRIDGFGYALTGGSAEHLMKMSPEARKSLLKELFDPQQGIGISCIRLTLGASDLNSFVFSYDDMPAGKEDFELKQFSLAQDLHDVVPVMREILAINPDIQILSSPWSAPAWMKTNADVRGGQLRKECYGVYADYFVRYVEAMRDHGIDIDAVTVQNEPLNSRNTPSMYWFAFEQADFIKNYLGPKFREAGLSTGIVVFDHNCDRPDYALAVYNDPEAAKYVTGAAFHHYRGDLSAISYVHEARPDKEIYFTEQMTTERPGQRQIAIAPAVERLIVGIMRNWSRNVVLWNLAADPLNDPHTDNGGCSMCQGALTIDKDSVSRNLAYYVIAHASKFVRPGSVRIASTAPGDRSVSICEDEQRPNVFRTNVTEHAGVAANVAFRTPDGRIVLVAANDSWSRRSIRIQYYRGDLSAMSYVHEARPDKEIYFTEQMTTERPGQRQIAIAPAVERLIVGIMRNWSRNVVLWNLAADPLNDPHTDNGGCSMCQGALTIDKDSVSRNLAYYVIAHASKFVRPGSVRIASTAPGDRSVSICEDEQRPNVFRTNVTEHAGVAANVAFRTPDGRIVLVAANDSWSRRSIRIQYNGRFAELELEPGAAGTFVWDE